MAVAAYYVLSALGLIVAAQATCSLRTTQDTYAPADQKIGVALSARSTIGHKWRVIDVQSDKVAASGALKDQSALALPIQPFTADFSSLSTVGTYQFRVDGCDEAPLFTIQNPLYERAERSEPRALRASSNTTKGYTDGGVARGVGIALVVITVLLFVVVLALCGWVIVLYCC